MRFDWFANQSKIFFRLKKWEKEVELIKQKKALYDLELDSKATFADYPLSAQERIIRPDNRSAPSRDVRGQEMIRKRLYAVFGGIYPNLKMLHQQRFNVRHC